MNVNRRQNASLEIDVPRVVNNDEDVRCGKTMNRQESYDECGIPFEVFRGNVLEKVKQR